MLYRKIKYSLIPILAVTLFFIILSVLTAPPAADNDSDTDHNFETFSDSLFLTLADSDPLTRNYTLAHPEQYGLKRTGGSLGTWSWDSLKTEQSRYHLMIEQLLSFSPDELNAENRFTRDTLLWYFETAAACNQYACFAEPLRPSSGMISQLPVLLSEYHFYTEEDVNAYFSLLKTIPSYLESTVSFEKERMAHGMILYSGWQEEMISLCQTLGKDSKEHILYLSMEERLEELALSGEIPFSRAEINRILKKNRRLVSEVVLPAYRKLAKDLKQLPCSDSAPKGIASFQGGKNYYSALVKKNTGSDRTIEELDLLLTETIETHRAAVTRLMADSSLLAEYSTFSYPVSSPEDILSFLSHNMEKDFTPLTKIAGQYQTSYSEAESAEIKYVQSFLEETLSPAFYLTPPIDNREENVIYINPKKSSPEELFATLGHEGYPGHLYQNVYFSLCNAPYVRYLLSFPGYSEGWGTYAEVYSYELAGLSDELTTLLQSQLILTLAIYGKMEIGVNYNCWTKKDMVNYLSGLGIEDNYDSDALYLSFIREPCQYLKYIVGYLEIEQLRETAKEVMGEKFTRKRYHDFLLSCGPAPFSLIEEKLRRQS